MSPCLKPNLIWFVLSTNFSSYYKLYTEVIMKAAVVSSFGAAPRYEEFPSPTAAGDDGTVVDVIAAGLHPRVRSQANGSHYTSTVLLEGDAGTVAQRLGQAATDVDVVI